MGACAQVHDAMSTLKMNLRQEHWETLSYGSNCVQLLTPWQMATLVVESQPLWCGHPLATTSTKSSPWLRTAHHAWIDPSLEWG